MQHDTGRKRILVTSALPYANGDIHLGHLLEAVQTDIFVRYNKLRGHDVIYVCADDTHGTPVELSALRQGISPEELVETARKNHIRDYSGYDISFDIFYTTNSEENRHYAELIYENLLKKDLVVEKEINQYYCENDKRFLPDRFIIGTCPRCKSEKQYGDVCEVCGVTYNPTELIEPKCGLCSKPPVLRSTKNIYVELAKRESFLREYIGKPGVLQDDMKNFVKSWIDDGLKEWCISRDGPYFGFRIPGTENKYFYVWMDAPIGYLSSTDRWCKDNGGDVMDYWEKGSPAEIVHFIGKDIVYFHALFWPVMLDSSDFAVPSSIKIHGFLNIQGEKMSKSRGTFILAKEYLEKVNHPQASEFLRFYYGSKLSLTSADLDLNKDELMSRVNTTLINNIGNLHHRAMIFCERYFENELPAVAWDKEIALQIEAAASEISAWYEASEFKLVVEKVHSLGSVGNKYFQDNKPWELMKTDKMAAASVIVTCVNLIKALAVFLKPIVPKISASVEKQLSASFGWDDYRFNLSGCKTGTVEKLVAPLESAHLDELFTAQTVAACADQKDKKERDQDGLIDISAFTAVDLRVGTVLTAKNVEKSSKLLCLSVDFGSEKRQIVAGIAQSYKGDDLIGQQVVAVFNLKPAALFGLVSEGMLLAAKDKSGVLTLVGPKATVSLGAKVA
ncbi:MAG: methionine--tRNA ligase [Chitinispirillales bacterium]|jgi:methionyl-tRNA synthetase|nr:methionine--tRNA ligase [Chitinispirillales bacterium]